MKYILAALVLLGVLACSREDSFDGQGSKLSGNGDSQILRVCNRESVPLYIALRAELGPQIYTDGWQIINPGECPSINSWDRFQGSKSYYIQSQNGRYTPSGTFYSELSGNIDSRATMICLPRGVTLVGGFSDIYDNAATFASGSCSVDRIRYQTTSLGYGDSGFESDTRLVTYTLQGGTFLSSERLISTNQNPGESPSALNEKISNLSGRLKLLESRALDCEVGVQAILSNGMILGTAIEKIDELKDKCEFKEDEYLNLRKKFQETKDLAKESISVLVAFLRGFYEKLSAIGSRIGVSAPYEDDYKVAGVGQLVRPAIDSELAGNAQGFFSRNADRYKETLMGYYGQYTGKFIAAALAFSSTYASFGVELGAQDEMDQDKVLDYLKSVSSIEEYFGTIDFDKGEYGYPTDSPVPNDIRKTVAEDIKPNAGAAGYELEVELKKWHGIATPQQALVLETIRYLGLAFQQAVLNLPGELREINKRLTSITEGAVQFIKDGSKCFTQVAVLGDYADWYEVISAQDLCTGEEITTAGRVISAVGIIGLSGKFWRAMGQSAGIAVSTKRVFKDSEAVVDYAKKWDGVESLLHVVKGNYQIAADGTRKLVSGMHTKLGFDNFLKLNQNAGKAYSIRNVTEFTAERIEAGGEILSQTLDNGVRRIQLPRDAWANNSAFSGANFPVSDSLRLKGVKTLWPDSYDIQKIGDITTRIVEANPSIRNDVIKATVDGLTVNVRVDPAGKVLTSFPAWNQ